MRSWKGLAAFAGMSLILAPGVVTAQSPAPVTLTVLEHQAARIEALNKIKPMCEESLKAQGMNVTLDIQDAQVADDSAFHTKLPIVYQGDSPPDITSYPGAWVPDFAAAGYLLDLTDRLAAWPDWSGHFYQVLRDRAVQADGKTYSMPRGGTVIEYFVRKDALEAQGISIAQPASWEDLITRAKEWHAKTGLPAITLPAGTQWGGGTFDEGFIHVFLGTGGQLYDDATGKWIVKSQALSDAFDFYAQLASNDLLPTQALLDPQPWDRHQVRRLHRHQGGRHGHPGRAAHHDPRFLGLDLRLGTSAHGCPTHRRPLRQGHQLGVPVQGRQRHVRLGCRGLDVDHLGEVGSSGRGLRLPAVHQLRRTPRDGHRRRG